MHTRLALVVLAVLALASSRARAKDTSVCVDVVIKEPPRPATPTPTPTTAPKPPPPRPSPTPPKPPAPETSDVFSVDEDGFPKKAPAPKVPDWTTVPPATPPTPVTTDAPGGDCVQSDHGCIDMTTFPVGQTPVDYLKRLVEHFVTHEPGYVAVPSGCAATLHVELYPLREGWTAFARYSGTGREERVDQLFPDELSQFAERVVTALLHDRPLSTTILRDTVLRSDSKVAAQRIHGTSHFGLGMGTQLRVARLPTTGQNMADTQAAVDAWRILSPVLLEMSYRGKFESWGVEAGGILGLGTSTTGPQLNTEGGHVDYGGSLGFALHFLRYLDPRGLTSFYAGAGGTFEMIWFDAILPSPRTDTKTLFSGGLDVDAIAGWEFMRASRVQFFLQGELNIPTYLVENSNGPSAVKAYFPGLSIKLGMLF